MSRDHQRTSETLSASSSTALFSKARDLEALEWDCGLSPGADGLAESGHQLGRPPAMTHPGLASTRGLERFRNQVC